MTSRGVFFEIGAVSSGVCATAGLWLFFTQHAVVVSRRINLLIILGLSLSIGVAVHQNVSFLIWFFQDYLESGAPSSDMSHHFVQGPITFSALAWTWFFVKKTIINESSSHLVVKDDRF